MKKETGEKFAIKIIDKKDAVFDAESLEQEVCLKLLLVFRSLTEGRCSDRYYEESESSKLRSFARRIRREHENISGLGFVSSRFPSFFCFKRKEMCLDYYFLSAFRAQDYWWYCNGSYYCE